MSEADKAKLEQKAIEIILENQWQNWWKSKKDNEAIHKEILTELEEKLPTRTGLFNMLEAKMAVRYGHILAFKLAKEGLKYSQLRRFFDAIKDLQYEKDISKRINKLVLFQIHLVNGQARKKELEPFVQVLIGIIANEWVKEEKDFERLFNLVDSVVAYFNYFE